MNEKLDKSLYEKYPILYQEINLPATQTCMCWGFSCDDGWYDIIDRLSAKLEEENNKITKYKNGRIVKIFKFLYDMLEYLKINNILYRHWRIKLNRLAYPEHIIAEQVKQKFGSLRFYINIWDDKLHKWINEAEEESINTCEACGSKDQVEMTKGWIRAQCRKCKLAEAIRKQL